MVTTWLPTRDRHGHRHDYRHGDQHGDRHDDRQDDRHGDPSDYKHYELAVNFYYIHALRCVMTIMVLDGHSLKK